MPTTSAFVGRSDELGQIRQAVEGVVAGAGRLFVLTGEPGIGKTRVTDEVSQLARTHGLSVHWGRCWEVGGAPAFWPWIQILRSLGRDAATASVASAYGEVLSRLLPELRADGAAPQQGEHAEARFRLFDELWAMVRNHHGLL
jgi:predicted ATPase